MKAHIKGIGAVTLILVGVLFMFYPFVSNVYASFHQSKIIQDHIEQTKDMLEEDKERYLEEAREYNNSLGSLSITTDTFHEALNESKSERYNQILNVNGDGIMGYIKIDKINVCLPIYHGTEEETLKKGIGHLENTTLPIGGLGTHSVLTGHRGMLSDKMFTDLNKLELGDVFEIQVVGYSFYYQVDQIKIVLPSDTEDLRCEEGKDLVTLITCTPYGINSHRLLVRGRRIEQPQIKKEEGKSITLTTDWYLLFACVIPLLILGEVYIFNRKKSNRNARENK